MTDTGKRMTLKELFDRKSAEAKAFAESPEGKAQHERVTEMIRQDMEAQRKWEAENPRDPFAEGAAETLAGGQREPPEEFGDSEQELWLAGFDSETGDET